MQIGVLVMPDLVRNMASEGGKQSVFHPGLMMQRVGPPLEREVGSNEGGEKVLREDYVVPFSLAIHLWGIRD